MDIGRTILALVVALAVAMPPTGFAMASASLVDMSMTDMSMAKMAMSDNHDCCPDHAPPGHADKGCKAMACALGCISFAGSALTGFALPSPPRLHRMPLLASAVLPSQAVGPPFRPPRS